LIIDASMLVLGVVSGLVGGWLAAFLWKRYIFPRRAETPAEEQKPEAQASHAV
jgi:hypothetical protein